MISLFAEPSVARRGNSSFLLSIAMHAAVGFVLYYGITHLPRLTTPLEHYSVRQLDLHALDPDFPNYPARTEKIPYPGPYSATSPELAEAMRSFLGSATGRQMLIQPQFHTHLSFAEQVPLPTVMIWTPELVARRKLVAPLPSPATASNVKPSLDLPNQEIRLAETAMASTELSPRAVPIPAATSSPLETRAAKPVQMAPATVSASADQPTPTAVLSISDVRVKDATILLPQVNEVAAGTAAKPAVAGTGSAASLARTAPATIARADAVDDIAIDGRRLTTEHIALPRDGKFNVVVVGSSLAEEYPETVEIWANRVAYTAYLHVGLDRNWILQYSVTRSADAAVAGNLARLEAPWPYDITRPSLVALDLHSDALMIHGILNESGRFEALAFAFPRGFRYASFVLRALQQWQFRPARQNGHATAVEVLLIIPGELD